MVDTFHEAFRGDVNAYNSPEARDQRNEEGLAKAEAEAQASASQPTETGEPKPSTEFVVEENGRNFIIENRDGKNFLVGEETGGAEGVVGGRGVSVLLGGDDPQVDVPTPQGLGTTTGEARPRVSTDPTVIDKIGEMFQPMTEEQFAQSPMASMAVASQAPVAGLVEGIPEGIANIGAALGLLDQKEVDDFFKAIDDAIKPLIGDRPASQFLKEGGEIIGQLGPLTAVAGKAFIKAGVPAFKAALASEAIAGFFALSPKEENIANLIPEDSEQFAPIRDFLATDQEDGDYVNRARNAAEAVTLLTGIAGAGKAFVKLIETAGPAAAKLKESVFKASDNLKAEKEQGIVRLRSGFDSEAMLASLKPLFDDPETATRISTRLPTAKAAKQDPLKESLVIDHDAMKLQGPQYTHNIENVIRTQYPELPKVPGETVEETAERFIEHAKSNLLWLHDQVPTAIRDRSHLWYDGAREITDRWSKKYRLPDRAIAGVMAALSPQKDWFQNVSLAERVLDTVTRRGNHQWDDKMEGLVKKVFFNEKGQINRLTQDLLDKVRGKRLDELSNPVERAAWVRTYDEAYHDRSYRIVTPEGGFSGVAQTAKGAPQKVGWGSFKEIAKAVSVIDDPSIANVSARMGDKHKVRNFYNNIIEPGSELGDVTIDTHAVAASLLRPLSGNSPQVSHNFGTSPAPAKQPAGWAATKQGKIHGAHGLYGLYADAYRRAAADRGIKAREMQSITWEAIRGLFPATLKGKKDVDFVSTLWHNYGAGKMSLDDVRNKINGKFKGIEDPAWVGRSSGLSEGQPGSSYTGELLSPRVSPGGARALVGGTGIGASSGVAELERDQEEVQVASIGSDLLTSARKALRRKPSESGLTNDELTTIRQAAENPGLIDKTLSDFNYNGWSEIEDIDAVFESLSDVYSRGIDAEVTAATRSARASMGTKSRELQAEISDLESVGGDPVKIRQKKIDLADLQNRIAEAERKSGPRTQTEEDSEWLAARTGMTVSTLVNRKTGQAYNAAELKAAKVIVTGMMKRLRSLHQKAEALPTDANIMELRRHTMVTGAAMLKFKGAQTEAGRALQSLRGVAKTPLAEAAEVNELMIASGGVQVNREFVERIGHLLEDGDEAALARFTTAQRKATTADMMMEAWINSLLGSPATHMVNFVSNSMLQVLLATDRYASALVGTAGRAAGVTKGGVTLTEANKYAIGLMAALPEAVFTAGRTFFTGEASDIFQKADFQYRPAITAENINQTKLAQAISPELLEAGGIPARLADVIGEWYYRLPGKLLMTSDDFFKTITYRAEVHGLAYREIYENGLRGQAAKDRYKEIVSDPEIHAPNIHLGAVDASRYATLTTEPGPFTRAIGDAREAASLGGAPIGRVIMPFLNVIGNIVKLPAHHTPFLSILGDRQRDILKNGTAAEKQSLIGKWVVGGSLFTMGGLAASNGHITGRITDNRKLKNQMELSGKQEYSVFLPWAGKDGKGQWVGFNRLSPVGTFFAISADTATALAYVKDPEERESIATAAMAAIVPYMQDQGFLTGVNQLFNALSPHQAEGANKIDAMSRYLSNILASSPGAIAGWLAPGTPFQGNLARQFDKTRRDARPDPRETPEYRIWERAINRVMQRTPGLSSTLPADMNTWGETRIFEGGLGPDFVSPMWTKDQKYDRKAIASIPGMPEKAYTINDFVGMQVGYDITEETLAKFINVVGINGELERLAMPFSDVGSTLQGAKLTPREESDYKYLQGKGVSLRGDGGANMATTIDGASINVGSHTNVDRNGQMFFGAEPGKWYTLKEALDVTIRTKEYRSLGDDPDDPGKEGVDTKAEYIKSIVNHFRKVAAFAVKKQHHDLQVRINKRRPQQ